jgi:resuscitation-promoting factor RpfB
MRLNYPLRHALYAIALAAILLPQQILSQPQAPSPSQPSTTSPATTTPKPDTAKVNCTSNGTYVNSQGQTVKRPETCSSSPNGATAQCRDGSYSFSQSHRGTCSHHGGVAKWL